MRRSFRAQARSQARWGLGALLPLACATQVFCAPTTALLKSPYAVRLTAVGASNPAGPKLNELQQGLASEGAPVSALSGRGPSPKVGAGTCPEASKLWPGRGAQLHPKWKSQLPADLVAAQQRRPPWAPGRRRAFKGGECEVVSGSFRKASRSSETKEPPAASIASRSRRCPNLHSQQAWPLPSLGQQRKRHWPKTPLRPPAQATC